MRGEAETDKVSLRKPGRVVGASRCPASLLDDSVQFVLLQRTDKTFVALAQRDKEKPREIRVEIQWESSARTNLFQSFLTFGDLSRSPEIHLSVSRIQDISKNLNQL